jgi:hypothetical protein
MGGTNQGLEGRNGEIWRQVMIYGWTEARCAQEHGITQQRVSQIVSAVRKELRPYVAEELIQQSMEFLRKTQEKAWEIAEMAGAPVAVGKDGTILTEPCDCMAPNVCDHPAKTVRDYSARLNALRLAHDIDKSVRKLHGLDAPEKKELSGNVRYEIVGVEDSDLT